MSKFIEAFKNLSTKEAVIIGATVATVAAAGVVAYKVVKARKAAVTEAAPVAEVAAEVQPVEGEIVTPNSKEDHAAEAAAEVDESGKKSGKSWFKR